MIGLVTGANRGLGLELVKEGLKRGHTIAAASRSTEEESVPELYALKREYGEKLEILPLDVVKEKQAGKAAKKVSESWGCVDFLFNNAGVLFEKNQVEGDCIADIDIEKFRETLDVNITGMAIVLKHFIRLLYQSQNACIMNITSEAGCLNPQGYNYLAYSVSKYGANMYTQKIRNYLWEEKPEKGIRIYMIHPGRMDTMMGKENAQIDPKESAEGLYEILEGKKKIPFMEIPFINYKGEPMPH